MSTAAEPQPEAGDDPNYELIEEFSADARTILVRARRRADRVPVLIKIPAAENPRPADLAALRNEFEIGRRISSPFVVTMLELGRYRDRPALVMTDCGGQSLDRAAKAPIPVGRFLNLAVSLAQGLADIHRAGVAHRDIKPKNIIVATGEETVRIIDFGIATLLPREPQTVPAVERAVGSMAYLSPEQTGRTKWAVDHRTDFYSLGVTFYELLTGTLPFWAQDTLEWVHCHLARQAIPPATVRPELPAALSAIVMKLLAKAPDERYQSASGLKADLETCRERWEREGRCDEFPLGRDDAPDRLNLAQRLYGREAETARLEAAFTRVERHGAAELLLVSGYSGIGKSSLVHELHRPIVEQWGFFLSGKFDQYQRDIPYATLVQAFRGLVRELLAASEERLAAWREKILAALGANGRVMLDIIPQLETIVGPQPPVADLPPAEARNRFNTVFRQFTGVFAGAGHPLVIFLDDLQWADAASLSLIEELITHPETRHVLLIAAYRDNEVDPAHPTMLSVERIRSAGATIEEIVLPPLEFPDLVRMLADALRLPIGEVEPLARLVVEKTAGNPFFVIQFVHTLHQEGLLAFNPTGRIWQWDLARIRERGFTDNVVDFMAGKLLLLGNPTLAALRLAACIGNSFDLATLAIALERPEEEVRGDLSEAMQEGLILPQGEFCRFLHDRVQQAAYSLIPEPERPRAHLEIGRLILARSSPEQAAERIFEIANHLNLGAALITDQAEKTRLAAINLQAGLRAKASTAFRTAIHFLAVGASLLSEQAWETDYDLSFALLFERAECEWLGGSLEEAEKLLAALPDRARTRIDQARAYRVKIDLCVTKSENQRAVENAIACLKLFGIEFSPHPTWEEVSAEYERVVAALGEWPIEELIDLPLMTDPETKAVMEVLATLFAPAYFTDNNLLYLHLCLMVNLSLRHGASAAATHGFAWFGIILGPIFHRYADGYRFGRLSHDLVERHGYTAFRAKANYSMELIAFWVRPLNEAIDYIRDAFRFGAETGSDLTVTCYSCNHIVIDLLTRGDPLDEVYRESEKLIEYARRARFRDVVDIIVGIQRFIRAMQGRTSSLSTFSEPGFDEAEYEAGLTGERMPTMVCWYYVMKLAARHLAGDFAAAQEAYAEAKKLIWASLSHPQLHDFHYYGALALAAPVATAAEAPPEVLAAIKTHRDQIAEWAANCPTTFGCKHALVAAEAARLEGEGEEAMRRYEEAIRSARENDFVQNEGLAWETAARFYRGRGLALIADVYHQQARACYARWGADGKVRRLDREHPRPREEEPPAPDTTITFRAAQLDALSVIKAAQSISGEILLPKLQETLIKIVLEHAGADRGCLVMIEEGGAVVRAEAVVEAQGVTVRIPDPPPAAGTVIPEPLVNFVTRTREPVVVGDSTLTPELVALAFPGTAAPKSALCLPIVSRTRLTGMLYLENRLFAGAFPPEKREVLQHLASQAAIAFENAALYAEVVEALKLRDEFLVIASHELRTPIATLRLQLEFLEVKLRAAAVSEEPLTLLKLGLKQVKRFEGLIRNLLDVTRLAEGRLELTREEMDLAEVVVEAVASWQPQLAPTHLRLAAPPGATGLWDRLRLEQLVANLLTNALKFGAGKPIEIRVAADTAAARLSVRDHGIGVNPEDRQRIFNQFERGVSSRSYGGLGLGLFISRQIVEAHGGTLRVESPPDGGPGAVFIAELPR